MFKYVYLLILNSTDDKEIVDHAVLRAEESEPNIFDPSKFNLVEEVSTKVKLSPIFFYRINVDAFINACSRIKE